MMIRECCARDFYDSDDVAVDYIATATPGEQTSLLINDAFVTPPPEK